MGETSQQALRVGFDSAIKLKFRGALEIERRIFAAGPV